jgi:hypothetical protein
VYVYLYTIAGMMVASTMINIFQSFIAEGKKLGILYLISATGNACLAYSGFMYASSTWH